MLNLQPQTGDMASYRRRKENTIIICSVKHCIPPTVPPSRQIQGTPIIAADPSAADAPLSHLLPLTSNLTHGLSPLRRKQQLRQRASQSCRPMRKASIAPTKGMHIESCFSAQNTPLYFVYSHCRHIDGNA